MAFCTNCGCKLIDGAKFCYECGTQVDAPQTYKKTQRTMVYDGEIYKCPNCGDPMGAHELICDVCGYERRGVQATRSLRTFAQELQQIENNRPISTKRSALEKAFSGNQISETDGKIILHIKNFPIPNTKEDMLEFLILASSNINPKRHNVFAELSETEKAISDAWSTKFEQAYEKAKMSFGDSPEFQKFHSMYIKRKSQTMLMRRGSILGITAIILAFVCFFLLLSVPHKNAEKQNAAENARLESIVEEVYSAIEAEDYLMARAKAATLVFSVHNGFEKEHVEIWDAKRENLLKVIDEAENKLKQSVSTTTTCDIAIVISSC